MTDNHHTIISLWRILLLLAACMPPYTPATACAAWQTAPCPVDTSEVAPDDTATGMNTAQKEYLDMKREETVQVTDAGEGNYILLATTAWAHNRNKVVGIFWVPRDIARYGRVNKEIGERRHDAHAHLSGIAIRRLVRHTPPHSAPFYSVKISDDLVLANGEAYDSKNAAHQGQPLYTLWEEHPISHEAARWLRLLIDNQLSNMTYQGPSIPMETTRSADLEKPKKVYGATEEEWRNAVMPENR